MRAKLTRKRQNYCKQCCNLTICREGQERVTQFIISSKLRCKRWRTKHPEAAKNYRITHQERIKEYKIVYNKMHKTERQEYSENYERNHQEEIKAKGLAYRNIPLNSNCSKCGSVDNLERHHPDYSKPLEIMTICRSCHQREHHQENPFLTISLVGG